MSGRSATKPFVSLLLVLGIHALKRSKLGVPIFKKSQRSFFNLRIILIALTQIIQHQKIRIIGGRGLLKTSMGLSQHSLQTLLKIRKHRGINPCTYLQSSWNNRFGQFDFRNHRAFKSIGISIRYRKPRRRNLDGLPNGILSKPLHFAIKPKGDVAIHDFRLEFVKLSQSLIGLEFKSQILLTLQKLEPFESFEVNVCSSLFRRITGDCKRNNHFITCRDFKRDLGLQHKREARFQNDLCRSKSAIQGVGKSSRGKTGNGIT